eukprot:13982224-Alexandrium_andersonii.AAC.1
MRRTPHASAPCSAPPAMQQAPNCRPASWSDRTPPHGRGTRRLPPRDLGTSCASVRCRSSQPTRA